MSLVTVIRVHIGRHERGLLFRRGDFVRALEPGSHWIAGAFDRLEIQTFDTGRALLSHPVADYLMAEEPELVDKMFHLVLLKEDQVGLRHEDGDLVEIIPPGARRLYWKGFKAMTVEVREIADPEVPLEWTRRFMHQALRVHKVSGLEGVQLVEVPEHAVGVLTIDGRVERLLQPGVHGFWKFGRSVNVEIVELRLVMLEISGQEILTRDKVALRINLSATWRYADVLDAHRHLVRPADHLYRELQFALRSAVATRRLDELLESREVLDRLVAETVQRRMEPIGLHVESVGIRDIILPGEMKVILAQVVEAEKVAEANVIRRREETAATRSLQNTARLMEGNSTMLRLKEMETLERISERIDRITVVGGLDQVLDGLVRIRQR